MVAGALPATALTLRGRVLTQTPGSAVTVTVWAQGEALRADPKLADAPLATAKVTAGGAFALEVPNAAPPLQVEATAAGHVGACFPLTLVEEADLPPLWLPAGRELRVRVTRDGKPEAGAVAQGYLARSGFGDAGYGVWRPYLPTQRSDANGVLTWWVPGAGSFGAVAVARDGRWGRVDRGLAAAGPVEVRISSRAVACKVVDERGEPAAGLEVAGAAAPEGTAVVSGRDGSATLQLSSEKEDKVVAWGEARAGRALVRPDARGPVVVRTAPRAALEVRWTGPPRLLLEPAWLPNAIARDAVIEATGGRARVPWLEGGGVLRAWAPGWTTVTVNVPDADAPVALTLAAAVRVEGVVRDAAQHPLAGVPVWGYLPPRWATARDRMSADRLGLPFLPWGVSDAAGRFALPAMPAGFVRLRATRAGFPAAGYGPAAAAAGSRVRATLTFVPGTTLAVRVQGPDGAPLAGVAVQAFARDASERPGAGRWPEPAVLRTRDAAAAAATGADGRASLAALPAGRAWVLLHLGGYVPRVLDAEVPAAGGDLGTQVLQPGAEVAGRVVDEAGAALAEADVSLGYKVDAEGAGSGRSDGEGRFAIPDLPREGEVYLLARRKGFFMAVPEKVALPPAGEVVLRLRRAATLAGTVVDAESKAPIANATVSASVLIVPRAPVAGAPVPYPTGEGANGRTDERGEFRLEGLRPGELDLRVRAPRYQGYRQPVKVAAGGEEQPLAVELKRGLTLRGQVLDAAGQPAAGVTIGARPAASSTDPTAGVLALGSARSGPDGTFLIEGLAPGRQEVRARAEDGANARALAEAGADDVVLRLEGAGAVQGRVRASDGAPAAGVEVRLFGGVPFQGDATSDDAGAFAIEQVPAGRYQVVALSRAGSARPQQVTVEAGRTAAVELTLGRTGAVAGTVRGLSPLELEGCTVYGGLSSARPGADGSFRIDEVREGAGAVRAVTRSGRVRSAPVEVKAGETATVEIDFGRGVTIAGTVARRAGPVAMLVVGAAGAGGSASTTTDAAGAFTIESVPPGSVAVTLYDLNGQPLLTRHVEADADTTLDLEVPEAEARGWVLAAADRAPIASATVTVQRAGDAAVLRSVGTDASGAFACPELEPGTYRLRAAARGFAGADAVAVVGDGASETTLLLEPDQGVDVIVRAPDGSAPATVYLDLFRGEAQQSELRLACDGAGRARIAGVPPGGYTGLFYAQGLAVVPFAVPGPALTVQLREAASLTVVTPVVASGPPWRVRVTDAGSGLPVPVFGPAGGFRLGWVEVRGGQANAGATAGTFLVEAVAPDGGTHRQTVTLAPNAVQTVRFP